MYLDQFGFQEKPFHITPNPRFIFLSKNHKDAFAHLLYGIQQRVGFLSLTGEVGTGKTTVLRTLLGQMSDDDYCLALILNPCLSALELIQMVHREFSIPFKDEDNLGQLHESLNKFLLEQREDGKTVVLVVDEAQNLDPSVLEELRLLSNLETETDKLIQMVLVGQPELEDLFNRSDLRQLRQRLVVRYRLLPMDAEDTAAYIQHRLKVAGWKGGKLFTDKAVQKIFRLTGGTPRMINILCDRALLVAYSQDLNEIDVRVLKIAQSELRQVDAPVRQSFQVKTSLVLLLLVIIVISVGLVLPRLTADISSFSSSSLTVQKPAEKEKPEQFVPEEQSAKVVTQARIEELQGRIATLKTPENAKQVVTSLLSAWGKSVGAVDFDVNTPELTLKEQGLLVSRFKGSLEELLNFQTPALVELSVPTSTGHQYFFLKGHQNNQILLEPALTQSGWIIREEFEQIWFGKALIAWVNPYNIPYLMEPNIEHPGISELQSLLRTVGFTDLPMTSVFDQATIQAITMLQRQNSLTPDGRVGSQTLLLLYRLAGQNLPEMIKGESS